MTRSVRIGNRDFHRERDGAAAALLTSAGWLLAQLPERVVQRRRGELVRTLAQARELVVEVAVGPAPAVRVRDGARLLVEIPAR
jgi:hypothetical protein